MNYSDHVRDERDALVAKQQEQELQDRFTMAALAGLLAGTVATDNTLNAAFAIGKRCMEIRREIQRVTGT